MGKIKVEIELDDLYFEGEDEINFTELAKKTIENRVTFEIWNKFKEDVMPSFESQVKRRIELDKELKIKLTVDELFKKPEFKKNYYDDKKVSLNEYIENYLTGFTLNSREFEYNIEKIIKKSAEDISKQLKDRYDILFASQIVTKLNEQGMLKEEVAKILLGN